MTTFLNYGMDKFLNKHLNLRLNELAQEAHLYAVYDYRYPEDMSEDYCMIFEKRFVELIIEECINTLEFHGFDDAVPYIKWMATNKLGVKNERAIT